MYDFYDYQKGYTDGYSPDKYFEACTFTNKNEIIMWAFGFKEGRKKYNEDQLANLGGVSSLDQS